jgi:hypothetical protein
LVVSCPSINAIMASICSFSKFKSTVLQDLEWKQI